MPSPPPSKRQKTSASAAAPSPRMSVTAAPNLPSINADPQPPHGPASPAANPKKRTASAAASSPPPSASGTMDPPAVVDDTRPTKRRTNTPWTAQEEQLLQQMRSESKGWSEIAKYFPKRTEGSVKKHWYKDMHYAEFNDDEANALREAIKEYEANKWKTIGHKVGKPAKACEQYARDNFKNL